MFNSLLNEPFFLFGLAGFIFLIIWLALLSYRFSKLNKRLRAFFNGKQAADLEGVLFEEIKRLKKAETDIKKLFQTSDFLEKMANQSIQKVGLIRFNPFKETGGDQSFAIALLDSKNNGLVISSLYSREGTRIYTKPIMSGQSSYPLSKEEIEALKKAGFNSK